MAISKREIIGKGKKSEARERKRLGRGEKGKEGLRTVKGVENLIWDSGPTGQAWAKRSDGGSRKVRLGKAREEESEGRRGERRLWTN